MQKVIVNSAKKRYSIDVAVSYSRLTSLKWQKENIMIKSTEKAMGENVIPAVIEVDVQAELTKIKSAIPFLIKGTKKSGLSVVKSGNKPNIKAIIQRIRSFNVDKWNEQVYKEGNNLAVVGNNVSMIIHTDLAHAFLRCYAEFFEQGFTFTVISNESVVTF